jgi:hypothetical protein
MRERQSTVAGSNRASTRRSLLTGALAAWVGAPRLSGAQDLSQPEDNREQQAVAAVAAKAGLRTFRTTRSRHYLGIGDASDAFRSLTLGDCEAVAADFLDYYQSMGFNVAMPAARLTVVILADARSLAAFNGDRRVQRSPTETNHQLVIPGHYEPSTNRLVVLDLHSVGSARIGLRNLRVVAHEATHQLTFNTGLLNLHGDVPRSIGEGLAVYGEIRKTTGRTAPGQLNRGSLDTLAAARRMGTAWPSVANLLADDRPFVHDSFARLRKLAYAEAWLLVHYLMKDGSRRVGFRAYLEAIQRRTGPEQRLHDAEEHLGDLDRLNRELVTYFIRLNKAN